jgi:hypothetical protein
MIVGMVSGSLLAYAMNQTWGLEHTGVGSIGALRIGFPPLSSPDFDWQTIQTLAPIAMAVALEPDIASREAQTAGGKICAQRQTGGVLRLNAKQHLSRAATINQIGDDCTEFAANRIGRSLTHAKVLGPYAHAYPRSSLANRGRFKRQPSAKGCAQLADARLPLKLRIEKIGPAQKGHDISARRTLVKQVRRVNGGNAPAEHDGDPVGDVPHDRQIVGDEEV